jgi:imidazolonepropionase
MSERGAPGWRLWPSRWVAPGVEVACMGDPRTDIAEWDSVWLDARLATLDPAVAGELGVIEDGAIGVRDGRITWVGRRRALPGQLPDTVDVHECGNAWLTPGLIDCHTHLVYGGERAAEFGMRLEGASYEAIARAGGGILSTVRATRESSGDELLAAARDRLRPLLREGVTTIEIKSGYGLDTETESRMLRVARQIGQLDPVTVSTSFLGAHALPPEYAGRADAYIDLVCEEMLPAVAGEGLADCVDAFCERIAFSPEQTARVFDRAIELDLPVRLHADQLSDGGGAALAARYNALSADHVEYAAEAGIVALARAGTVAVLLPGAFYFLRETRVPPVARFRHHGVPMALASDHNPGSSPARSLVLMINMGCVLFGLTPAEAIAGVTRNAARALGLDGRSGPPAGVLAAGARADFVLWPIDAPVELAYGIGGLAATRVVRGGIAAGAADT